MKKILLLITILALGSAVEAGAWGKRNHAAIAYIAEQHMTPKAKKKVYELLDGQSMVGFASHLDYYKKEMMMKVRPPHTYHGKSERTIPHVFRVDSSLQSKRWYAHENLSVIEESMENLKDYKNLDDSTRTQDILNLIHLVGDIHCPAHMIYDDNRDRDKGYFNVTFKGKQYRFHNIWDQMVIDYTFAGGVEDLAYLADTYSKKEIKEVQSGTIWDWGTDIAARTHHIFDVESDSELSPYYMYDNAYLALDQIARAGYRLAKVMNDLFD